jgi:hypothetical protein
MKKEEFPTFLNEQPTVVFGRTTRELLIIVIGLSSGYLFWNFLQSIIHSMAIGAVVLKGSLAAIPIILSLIVALVKIATLHLEEWAVIGLSYLVIPKVFYYMPSYDSSLDDDESIMQLYGIVRRQNANEDYDD